MYPDLADHLKMEVGLIGDYVNLFAPLSWQNLYFLYVLPSDLNIPDTVSIRYTFLAEV